MIKIACGTTMRECGVLSLTTSRFLVFLKVSILHLPAFFSAAATYAQTSSADAPIKWQAPLTAWLPTWLGKPIVAPNNKGAHKGIDFYWEKSGCDQNGIIVGKPRIAIKNEDPGITIKNVWVGVVAINCDHKETTAGYSTGEIKPYEFKMEPHWDENYYPQIVKVISCHFNYDVDALHYC